MALLLSSCSDGQPLKITKEYESYVGVWQYRHEVLTDNSTEIDNILLVINSDGSSEYRKCKYSETKSKNSSRKSSKSISFPTAFVTSISDKKITLIQKIEWFGFKAEIDIDDKPQFENGSWFLSIEGKKLTLLKQEEIDSETNWSCPSDNEET